MDGVRFSQDAAVRTREAVKGWEKEFASLAGETRPSKGNPFVGFYARITAQDPTGKLKYSWEKLEPQVPSQLATNVVVNNDEWGSGDYEDDGGYAVEIYGSKYVLNDSIVRLYPSLNQDYFLFAYDGGTRFAKSISSIPGKTDSAYGSGNVSVFKRTGAATPVDTNQDVLAFNNMSSEIAADTDIQITYNQFDACWIVP